MIKTSTCVANTFGNQSELRLGGVPVNSEYLCNALVMCMGALDAAVLWPWTWIPFAVLRTSETSG